MNRIVFPRSAAKPLQCLALASLNPDLSKREYAVICSSHNGQFEHVETVQELLKRNNLTEDDLVCGGHWSLDFKTSLDQIRKLDRPKTLLSNCSGKHTGMVILSQILNISHLGYENLNHPVQKQIIKTINSIMGLNILNYPVGVDGCGVPAFSAPIKNWATAFARFASGENLSSDLANACKKITLSIAEEPLMIAGERRICTEIARSFGNKITAKMGAEGVYVCSLNDKGLGLFLKCRDGSKRAVEFALGSILETLKYKPSSDLKKLFNPKIYNWAGKEIGLKSIKNIF